MGTSRHRGGAAQRGSPRGVVGRVDRRKMERMGPVSVIAAPCSPPGDRSACFTPCAPARSPRVEPAPRNDPASQSPTLPGGHGHDAVLGPRGRRSGTASARLGPFLASATTCWRPASRCDRPQWRRGRYRVIAPMEASTLCEARRSCDGERGQRTRAWTASCRRARCASGPGVVVDAGHPGLRLMRRRGVGPRPLHKSGERRSGFPSEGRRSGGATAWFGDTSHVCRSADGARPGRLLGRRLRGCGGHRDGLGLESRDDDRWRRRPVTPASRLAASVRSRKVRRFADVLAPDDPGQRVAGALDARFAL